MELPDALKSLGEQIEAGADIAPDDDFFEAYDVFSAEMSRGIGNAKKLSVAISRPDSSK